MRFDIPAGQDYLDDFAFWFTVKKGAGDFDPLNVPTGLHKFIRSVEIKADGKQILYVDHARFLIDIMVKKKRHPDEHLVHKFEDYPLDYQRYDQTVAVVAPDIGGNAIKQKGYIPVGTNQNVPVNGGDALETLNKKPMSKKQLALYRYIQNAKLNRDCINEGLVRYANKGAAAVENDQDVLWMRNQVTQKYCLFRLSDLGLWKSFPRFLLK